MNPGTYVDGGFSTVNTGDKILVLDEETRGKLIEARRQQLALMAKGTEGLQ